MSALAREHNAINLSQGFPDFNTHPQLIDLVNDAMKKGMNQYSPMQGYLPLREMIAEKTEALYSASYDPDKEITITAGATQAIFTAIAAFIRDGDEAIIIEPAYDCYAPAIELCGGILKYIKLDDVNFSVNWDDVKKLVTAKTKLIIINTPHNPTGSILNAADLIKLQKITKDKDIIVISDEVYEHIIFDGVEHQSVARFPDLAKRSFIVSSFGKTYHTTGWKVGYVMAPENLMTEFRKVHQYNVFCVNTPIQVAYAELLKQKDLYLELGDFYKQKRDHFKGLLKGSRFGLKPVHGSYFQLVSYDKISDEKDVDFAARLTKEYGVAPIPMSVFYNKLDDNRHLRLCFAKENTTLEKAAEKLMKV